MFHFCLHSVAVEELLVGGEVNVDAHFVDHINKGAMHELEEVRLLQNLLQRVQPEREDVLAHPCTQPRQFAEGILEATRERHGLQKEKFSKVSTLV